MPLAAYVRKYFWDINPNRAKPKSHPAYYIQRILELGDTEAFDWLKHVYGVEAIKRFSRRVRLSSKSKRYWALKLR